jgi:hypothetical protein
VPVKTEVFAAVDYEKCCLQIYKTQFAPHRRHITSLLQSPTTTCTYWKSLSGTNCSLAFRCGNSQELVSFRNWNQLTDYFLSTHCGYWTDLITAVYCLPYTTPSWPNRKHCPSYSWGPHSWLSCTHVLLLESPAYPWKCLTFRYLVMTSVFNLWLHSNDRIRPNTSQYCLQYLGRKRSCIEGVTEICARALSHTNSHFSVSLPPHRRSLLGKDVGRKQNDLLITVKE